MERNQKTARGTIRIRMAVAFMAGMVLTAALAQFPAAADIFSQEPGHESAVPPAPDVPDFLTPTGIPESTNPAKPFIGELVFTLADKEASPC